MRHFIAIFLGLMTFLNASSLFNLPEYQTPLIKTENGYGEVLDSNDIVVGSSGVVMHTFGNGESSIIARAVVTEKKMGMAKVRFEVFDLLSQQALPVPGILPKVGDRVVLNFLYNRSLIITPNEEVYRQVVNTFPNITFIHPDIAASYLNEIYRPNPSRDDFREICSQNAAGLLFIALDNLGVFADCGSFQILKEFKTGEIAEYVTPFYSRITTIKPVFWKWDTAYMADYNYHYKFLLDIKE
ncbi:putative plasminogen-binding protein [Campylobacter blaseri]|uniref:Plasminogen-binding protein PgbA N-terminal domain-containing protein n=1 Tax=Campylobacter blaseri TaxID=2042961 RepID=A0A2P8QZU3_9BACT|nr:plasminogen-binding N-terminal domain-containing protein [Campylobacter blaseri]PSM51769.1 hypothetical protein CQ405_06475 [Campylobacter blaseri]PSM53560.1 hypothetical protein CRN67_06480 [Campylobacter blaseri]QKF86369.1 putative plasminogen-binding protein [Campylobacter blaseri]